jgi:hypothetical protein
VAAAKPKPTTLEQLAAKFPAKLVKDNPRGFPYISIDTAMNRLDEVLGAGWHLDILNQDVSMLPRSEYTYGRNEKTAFMAQVTVRITALIDGAEVSRSGIGADVADDPDKVVKTALANAVKKAGNAFGIGRYLWDAEERADLKREQEALQDVKALKRQLVTLYETTTGKELEGTAAEKAQQLATAFGVEPGDLGSPEVLSKLLADAKA